MATLDQLFLGVEGISCRQALDANDDGGVDISDAIHTLSFLFAAGAAIPAPGLACGEDPTPDLLSCVSFPGC